MRMCEWICTFAKGRLYLYNLESTAALLLRRYSDGKRKILENAEKQSDSVADERKNFDAFIGAMVQIVEKYGKSVLQDLDCVA